MESSQKPWHPSTARSTSSASTFANRYVAACCRRLLDVQGWSSMTCIRQKIAHVIMNDFASVKAYATIVCMRHTSYGFLRACMHWVFVCVLFALYERVCMCKWVRARVRVCAYLCYVCVLCFRVCLQPSAVRTFFCSRC